MIYYNNNFKSILRAFIRALKVFFSSFVSKSVLITTIFFLILLLFINENHVEATTITEDPTYEIIQWQDTLQNNLVLFSISPFINNTSAWNNGMRDFYYAIIDNNCDIVCGAPDTTNSNGIIYKANLYYWDRNYSDSQGSFGSQLSTTRIPVMLRTLNYTTHYDFTHNIQNNTISTSVLYPNTVTVQHPILRYKSEAMIDFLGVIQGYKDNGSINYQSILNIISNHLSSIETIESNQYVVLQNILQTLQTIANKTENDYTQQIDDISNQVNSVSSSIQAQTQQQHQDAQATQNAINNQTQQQHQDAQATQNTIEESTNSILSTDADDITMEDFGVQSPTIEGSPDLTNIFNLIYNSFMSVYEDDIYRIQFKLPSGDTTYNFDIPANALRDKLPDGLIVLISVFWWVILGGAVISFIVKIIHQIVTYSNGSVDGSSGGFLSELTMTPTEFVLFNILH